MWLKVVVFILVIVAFVITAAVFYGKNNWRLQTKELYAEMEAARQSLALKSYDSRISDDLPEPVRRFFQTVLKEGQSLVTAVNLEHTGTFNMSESGEQWKVFRSTQRVIVRRPGFVWDARIQMAPLMTVHVHDAYVAGRAVLTAKLFGLLTVMKQPDTPELAQGELMRFFPEAAWYPTALLPGQGVTWEAIDDARARAILRDGNTNINLVFRFDEQGLISTVHSDGRFREVDGKLVKTPWQGRFWDYERRDGMLIPLEAEVAWLLQDKPKPYWRGRIRRIGYEYAR